MNRSHKKLAKKTELHIQHPPNVFSLYRNDELWKKETITKPPEEWTVSEVRRWIETNSPRHQGASAAAKHDRLVQKVLKVMEQEDVDGSLLLAGGKDYLFERASTILKNKADKMRLPHVITTIYSTIHEACQDLNVPHGTYWDRLEIGGNNALAASFRNEYGAKRSHVGCQLRRALLPQPIEAIELVSICHLVETATNVKEADRCVNKSIDDGLNKCIFKIVSVAPRTDPMTVWTNLIYARSDLDGWKQPNQQQEEEQQPSLSDCIQSRKTKRKLKKRKGKETIKVERKETNKVERRWELLVSVDFAWHGMAAPGHWHLNMTSNGDALPHLSIQIADEEEQDQKAGVVQREVWHGSEYSCPLFWHLIPDRMHYKCMPARIKACLQAEPVCS